MFVPGVFTQSRNAFYGYATYIAPEQEEEPVLQVKLGETDVSELPVLSSYPSPAFTVTNPGYTYAFQIVAGSVKAWTAYRSSSSTARVRFTDTTSGYKIYGLLADPHELDVTATNAKSITQGRTISDGTNVDIRPTIYSQ